MHFLTVDDVLLINAEILGGQALVRDHHVLESAVSRMRASAFGQDAYPTLFDKAGALMHSLILNHPFIDGNKRTGVVATLLFLKYNGFVRVWDEDEAYTFIIGIAEGKHSVNAIAGWLEQNTKPLE